MRDYASLLEELEAVERHIASFSNNWEEAMRAEKETKGRWELAYCQAYVQTEGTVAERNAQCVSQLAPLHEAMTKAAADAAVARMALSAAKSRISSLQSELKSMTREAPQNGPQPQWSVRA